jgi:hypothetical protein
MTAAYLNRIKQKPHGEDVDALIAEVERLWEREIVLLEANNAELERRRSAQRQARALQLAFDALVTRDTIQDFLAIQWDWSRRTFGQGYRTEQILDHIRKEIREIEADPTDRIEWLDIALLALDGYQRPAGGTTETLMPDLLTKQAKNFKRKWVFTDDGRAVEHDRSEEEA